MKKTQSLKKGKQSVNARHVAYSMAAGAAACTTGGMATQAEAAVSYSGIYNIDIAQFNSQNLDLDLYLGGDVVLKNYVFGGGNYQGASINYAPGQLVISNASFPYYVSALSAGDTIDGATVGPTFSGSMAYGVNANSEFDSTPSGGAFIGLSFPAGAFGTLYGWIRVDIDNQAGTFNIRDWAYEDSGAGILAGDTGNGFVPEPGALGLLAAGSAGLLSLRRRRDEAA